MELKTYVIKGDQEVLVMTTDVHPALRIKSEDAFETMIYPDWDANPAYRQVYSSESEAADGHLKVVEGVQLGEIKVGEYDYAADAQAYLASLQEDPEKRELLKRDFPMIYFEFCVSMIN